jgi:hypothetical protein
VDVVADAGTRGLPGLSYTYPGAAPEQLGLSVDGESLQPVTLASPDAFAPADYLPEAVAFELVPGARVLVLDPGGGLGLLQALAGGAADVTAVVSDPLALEAVSSAAGDFDPYADPRVTVVRQPLRAHLRSGGAQYDLVFLPFDSYVHTGGADSLPRRMVNRLP